MKLPAFMSRADGTARKHPPLSVYLRRRTRTRLMLAGGVLSILALGAWLDRPGRLAESFENPARWCGQRFVVERVFGGGGSLLARPIGMNRQLTVSLAGLATATQADDALDRAAELIERMCLGRQIRLRDAWQEGERALAVVELSDGTLLHERLLAAGFARASAGGPSGSLSREQILERQARHDRVGWWSQPR